MLDPGPVFHVVNECFHVFSDHIDLGPTEVLHFHESWIYYDTRYWTCLRFVARSLSYLTAAQLKLVQPYDRVKAIHPDKVRVEPRVIHTVSDRFQIGRK